MNRYANFTYSSLEVELISFQTTLRYLKYNSTIIYVMNIADLDWIHTVDVLISS
jgi:hypothetical protein